MLFFPLRPASLAFYTCFTSFASVCCVSRWLEPQSFWLISYRSSSHSLLDSSIGSPYLVAHLVGALYRPHQRGKVGPRRKWLGDGVGLELAGIW